jgi:hypothetical protein
MLQCRKGAAKQVSHGCDLHADIGPLACVTNLNSLSSAKQAMASVQDAIATMARNIETQTGRGVADWVALARATGLAKHGEILKWLKAEHGLGHGYANFLALRTLEAGSPAPVNDNPVDELFAGPKSALRPLYDQLVAAVGAFGPDVEIAPKKNNVSLRRAKQFGLLQPSTATRLDVGLILKDVEPAGRLEVSGSFNAMFTHRVRVSAAADIDAELKAWLRRAYDAA